MVEGQNTNWLKSSAKFIQDIAAPGTISLTTPIDGVSRELRHNARYWRVRLGHAAHAYWAVESAINENYFLTAMNIGALAIGCLSVGYPPNSSSLRRLKRMYLP